MIYLLSVVQDGGALKSSDWLNISGWIFGAIGFIIAIWQVIQSHFDKKTHAKEHEAQKFLYRIAEEHIDKNSKKEEIDNLKNTLSKMQKTIEQEIPKEAQKIALSNIIDNEVQLISDSYTKLISMKEKLRALSSPNDDEKNELLNNVYKQISPSYSQRKNQQVLSNLYILISVTSSLISVVVPYQYNRPVIFIVMAIQLIFAIYQVRNYLLYNFSKEDRSAIFHILVPFISLASGLFSGLLTVQMFAYGLRSNLLSATITVILLILLHFASALYYCLNMSCKGNKVIVWIVIILLTFLSVVINICSIFSDYPDYSFIVFALIMLTLSSLTSLVYTLCEVTRYRRPTIKRRDSLNLLHKSIKGKVEQG